MTEFLLTAPGSGTGKTTLMTAVLTLLRREGRETAAFKCGPDYIDPMYHRAVEGVHSYNLDLFLNDASTVRRIYSRYTKYCDAAVVEGVMGHYDGVGGSTDRASSWHLADTLGLPCVLTMKPEKASLTLAAQLKGLQQFRDDSHLAGIVLNDCRPAHVTLLSQMLERETGLPVYGCLPHVDGAEIPSRHLGLFGAEEIPDLDQKQNALADALQENCDTEKLFALTGSGSRAAVQENCRRKARTVIAIVLDEAFRFYYPDAMDTLWEQGADLYFFSPLRDRALPEAACGLYLPGGYPELYAEQLSANESMRRSIRTAVQSGMPTVAECGGFLYLGQALDGHPMAGALPGEAQKTSHPVRFGYTTLTAAEDSLLFRAGESIPAHSFHYYESSRPGTAFRAEKPVTGRSWETGYASPSLYAAFEHFSFTGHPEQARRFVDAAEEYGRTHR